MLSDTTIKRDSLYSFPRRVILKLRKYTAPFFRKKLDAEIMEKLEGIEFSIFGNNCLAGVFYHDAGREFTTPTVNTAFDGEDFVRFLERPQHYLEHEMEFISWPGHDYPIARIDDIEVRFVHYKTAEEAESIWRRRAERINWNNLFIVATNHDGAGKPEIMERFDRLPYKNKIMFVSEDYPQYDWAVVVPQFKGRFQVRIMTAFANFRGQRYYETCFDIAKWIRDNSKDDAKSESYSSK